jgi:hypothetical protein
MALISSADKTVGESVQIRGTLLSGSGPGPGPSVGPDYVAYGFVFLGSIVSCRLYK